MKRLSATALAAGLCLLTPIWCHAAGPEDLSPAQRQAMLPLALLDGIWRGPATVTRPDGSQLQLTQTERVGPFLGGAVRLIEGRGYDSGGKVAFNAFAVISFDAQAGKYNFRSHSHGRSGDFPMELRPDGLVWSLQAGPAARIRYTISIKDNIWHEIGEMLVEGKPPQRIFQMQLQRVGDTTWPEGGAVPPR